MQNPFMKENIFLSNRFIHRNVFEGDIPVKNRKDTERGFATGEIAVYLLMKN